jgi:hypothetical protein
VICEPQVGIVIPNLQRAAAPGAALRRARAMFSGGLLLLASSAIMCAIALVSLVEVSALERKRMLGRVCRVLLSRAATCGFRTREAPGSVCEFVKELQ